jgi:hypothetical protein
LIRYYAVCVCGGGCRIKKQRRKAIAAEDEIVFICDRCGLEYSRADFMVSDVEISNASLDERGDFEVATGRA